MRCLTVKLCDETGDNAEDVLVLEDMAVKGYAMVDRTLGLPVEHCLIIVRNLARLHATSLALRHLRPEEAAELESNIREVAFAEGNDMLKEMVPLVESSYKYIEDRYPEGTPEHTKLKNFTDNYLSELAYLVTPNDTLSCITHGDCWSNNVLFKFTEEGKVEDICLLDFQISRVASPVLDIVYVIFTCTTKETRDAHYQEILKEYHDAASSVLEGLGCDPEVVFSWSTFQDQLKEYGRFGLAMALITIPIFLADSSEVPQDIDSMMENNADLKDIFGAVTVGKLDEVRKRMCDVLSDSIELEYL